MNLELLTQRLTYLQLPFTRDNYTAFAQEAAAKHRDHIQFLDSLVQGESDQRRQRVIQRRIKEARFPVLTTLQQFRRDGPKTISQRYERGSIILTTNKAFKQWPSIFNNDSTITSAVLDRLLHHAETIVIEGSSFRMKDQLETSPTAS